VSLAGLVSLVLVASQVSVVFLVTRVFQDGLEILGSQASLDSVETLEFLATQDSLEVAFLAGLDILG
jgi:hypothetical protein